MFLSVSFFIFLILLYVCFCILPGRYRLFALTVFSMGYLLYLDRKGFLVFTAVMISSVLSGKIIEKNSKYSKIAVIAGISCFVGLLFWEKMKIGESIYLGLSFYCFQAIAYLLDCYHKKIPQKTRMIEVATALSFWPKFVSGPIEKVQTFVDQGKQIEQVRLLEKRYCSEAFNYFLIGMLLKIGIADRSGHLVDQIYMQIEECDSLLLVAGSFLYSIQIYGDFAGYTMMALGVARLFGVRLTDNFKTPYFSQTVGEFWNRWHISLSSFFKEYLYIPLGGNRKGLIKTCRNTMIVFLVCGLWHGKGTHYLVWGALHGLFLSCENIMERERVKSRLRTFLCVNFAWIFFRAGSTREALLYVKEMCLNGISIQIFREKLEQFGFFGIEGIVLLVTIIGGLVLEILAYRKAKTIPEYLLDRPRQYRFLIYYVLIIYLFVFGIYGHGFAESKYIYMQF